MFRVNAKSSREVQATILSLRTADKQLRKEMHADVRREVGGMWLGELRARARTPQDHAVVVKGGRIASRTDGFRLLAAQSRKALRGGFYPDLTWYAVEFGARNRRQQVTRRTKTGSSTYTALINKGLPGRVSTATGGRIAFDAASKIITRSVAVWVKTIVNTYRKAANG